MSTIRTIENNSLSLHVKVKTLKSRQHKLSKMCTVNEGLKLQQAVVALLVDSDGVKARAPTTKAKAKVKAKDKVLNRDQGLRQGHDEPTQYHFLLRKYLPVTNSVY